LDIARWVIYPNARKNIERKYGQHSEAKNVLRTLGLKRWNAYYKFCFERNPWDKVVSAYFYHLHYYKKEITFEYFVREMTFYNSSYIYRDAKGKVMVDYIARYENMQAELKYISEIIGISFDGFLPDAKSEMRADKKHYSEYYNDETRLLVERKCKDVIDLMGYKFES